MAGPEVSFLVHVLLYTRCMTHHLHRLEHSYDELMVRCMFWPGTRWQLPFWHVQVVQMVCKCGENSTDAVQLAVIRALLTVATAEHFIVHGDCLMQAVSTGTPFFGLCQPIF